MAKIYFNNEQPRVRYVLGFIVPPGISSHEVEDKEAKTRIDEIKKSIKDVKGLVVSSSEIKEVEQTVVDSEEELAKKEAELKAAAEAAEAAKQAELKAQQSQTDKKPNGWNK